MKTVGNRKLLEDENRGKQEAINYYSLFISRSCSIAIAVCERVSMGEPGRRKSYSEDLRWRIVWQRKV